MKTGVLLVNLGSTAGPEPSAVRKFLREFLSDPRVIDLPALGRFLLLNLIILPFRPRKTAEAYRQIWHARGSAILFHSEDLGKAVQALLNKRGEGGRAPQTTYHVETAMRYGAPALKPALAKLRSAGVTRTIVIPLYPQYSAATTGSTLARIYELAGQTWDVGAFDVIHSFYDHPGFVKSFAAVLGEKLAEEGPVDHILFSFHGLPERQIRKSDPAGVCLSHGECCANPEGRLSFCYRAQCMETARRIAEAAGTGRHAGGPEWSVSFQSRLGRDPWITPYTDATLVELAKKGVKRVAVVCPAFVADCLETLEEIGIRAKETFIASGGSKLVFVPSLNSRPDWAAALVEMITARETL